MIGMGVAIIRDVEDNKMVVGNQTKTIYVGGQN